LRASSSGYGAACASASLADAGAIASSCLPHTISWVFPICTASPSALLYPRFSRPYRLGSLPAFLQRVRWRLALSAMLLRRRRKQRWGMGGITLDLFSKRCSYSGVGVTALKTIAATHRSRGHARRGTLRRSISVFPITSSSAPRARFVAAASCCAPLRTRFCYSTLPLPPPLIAHAALRAIAAPLASSAPGGSSRASWHRRALRRALSMGDDGRAINAVEHINAAGSARRVQKIATIKRRGRRMAASQVRPLRTALSPSQASLGHARAVPRDICSRIKTGHRATAMTATAATRRADI